MKVKREGEPKRGVMLRKGEHTNTTTFQPFLLLPKTKRKKKTCIDHEEKKELIGCWGLNDSETERGVLLIFLYIYK